MLATGAHARGRIFGHTRNINLQLEQSVDGINIAHRSEACSARLDDLTHDTTNPPHPQLNVDLGNIYSIREGSPRRAKSTLHLEVRGNTTCKLIFVNPLHTQKFRAIFLPSTVRTGQVVGERKEERMERLALTPWTVGPSVDRPVDRSVDRVFL